MLEVAGFDSRTGLDIFSNGKFLDSLGINYGCTCHTIILMQKWYRQLSINTLLRREVPVGTQSQEVEEEEKKLFRMLLMIKKQILI